MSHHLGYDALLRRIRSRARCAADEASDEVELFIAAVEDALSSHASPPPPGAAASRP